MGPLTEISVKRQALWVQPAAGPTSQLVTNGVTLELVPPKCNSHLPACTVGGWPEQGGLRARCCRPLRGAMGRLLPP